MQRPPVRARGQPPAFLDDEATLVFSSTRDEHGERVVLVTWHQGDAHDAPSRPGQMQLSTLDVERLRDFCDAWLSLVPPPEPREAA